MPQVDSPVVPQADSPVVPQADSPVVNLTGALMEGFHFANIVQVLRSILAAQILNAQSILWKHF